MRRFACRGVGHGAGLSLAGSRLTTSTYFGGSLKAAKGGALGDAYERRTGKFANRREATLADRGRWCERVT